jgi:hypothetical protein
MRQKFNRIHQTGEESFEEGVRTGQTKQTAPGPSSCAAANEDAPDAVLLPKSRLKTEHQD